MDADIQLSRILLNQQALMLSIRKLLMLVARVPEPKKGHRVGKHLSDLESCIKKTGKLLVKKHTSKDQNESTD